MKKLATILGVWTLVAGFAMAQEDAAGVPATLEEAVIVEETVTPTADGSVISETTLSDEEIADQLGLDDPAATTLPDVAPAADDATVEVPAPAAAEEAAEETAPAAAEEAAEEPAPAAAEETVKEPAPAVEATETAAPAAPAEAPAAAAADETPTLAVWEMIAFCVVVVGVIGLGIWKSGDSGESEEEKKEKGAADYFLAGRGLSWWLVGFSLIAANISTEQFVGMSGKAANWVGLAIAGYEWLAAIVLVIVAFSFLPMLLKRGVFTIPQFLEERFDGKARTIMAVANLVILVGVPTAGVIFAGAKVVSGYFDLSMTTGCIIIGACATIYVFVGGLKACAWTDLIWGAALIVGGGVVAWFAIDAIGTADPNELIETASATSGATVDSIKDASGIERFFALNGGEAITATNEVGGKMHMIRPADDMEIPWTALCLGLWIPNFFYWGLNQYIMQRTLASKSLAEGQMGIVFAAGLKLLIPFVVLIPGILAYNLFSSDMKKGAEQKAADTITAVEKSGKTPLYNVTADYLMTYPEQGIAYLAQNAEKAGKPETVTAMKKLTDDLARVATAPQEQVEAIAKTEYQIAIPESVKTTDAALTLANTKRVVCASIADKAAKLNGEILKSKATDDSFMATEALNGYDYDSAFGMLLKNLLPGTGWAWFVLAALFGAVVSSLASMLNSASTLFTMDIYHKLRSEKSSQSELVAVGKVGVLVFSVIALLLAIFLSDKLDSIFSYIQEFQGFLSPGALAVFIFGFFVPKCPRFFGWLGIAINVVEYGILKVACTDMAFLNRMAVCLITIVIVGAVLTAINAARGGEAVVLQDKGILQMSSSSRAKVFGTVVVLITIALYILFW